MRQQDPKNRQRPILGRYFGFSLVDALWEHAKLRGKNQIPAGERTQRRGHTVGRSDPGLGGFAPPKPPSHARSRASGVAPAHGFRAYKDDRAVARL